MLQDNKKAWHKNLIHALWADRITTKRSIATSHFQIVYGTQVVFPTSLGMPILKLMQENEANPNYIQRRINQLIHVQQMREEVYNNTQLHQDKMKKVFDKQTKVDDFKVDDLVMKYDARNEDKGKHGKFDYLWLGPFKIVSYHGSNAYLLQEINGDIIGGGLVNAMFVKHYFT